MSHAEIYTQIIHTEDTHTRSKLDGLRLVSVNSHIASLFGQPLIKRNTLTFWEINFLAKSEMKRLIPVSDLHVIYETTVSRLLA